MAKTPVNIDKSKI